MPYSCYICRAVSTKVNVSMFCVPDNEVRRRRWTEACGYEFSKSAHVCHMHFDAEDFINGPPGNKKCRLMPGSVPKRFLTRYSKSVASSNSCDFKRCSKATLSNEMEDLAHTHDNSVNTDSTFITDPIIPKDEIEISIQDLQFDYHHKRKCGEIVLDTYDSTFTLNCSLCSTICLDLITFSEHVKKQHESLLQQRIKIENKLDDVGEDIYEANNSNLRFRYSSESNNDSFIQQCINIENKLDDAAEKIFEANTSNFRLTNSAESDDDSFLQQCINIENKLEVEIFEENNSNLRCTNLAESNNEIESFEVEFVNHASNECSTDSSTEYNKETDNFEIDFKNHAVVSHFIKLLKQKPFIWSTAQPHRKRKIGLMSFIDPLSKKFPRLTFTYTNLFTLLRAIRVAFQNELKQMKDTQNRGIEYIPQLWFFDKLKFVESLNDEAEIIQQKIYDLNKIAEISPLESVKIMKLEFISHYKEQPHLWNINHPEYSGKFEYTGFQKFYEFLRQNKAELITQIQLKTAIEEMLNWFTAVEDIRLHMKKLNQPFNSYYPQIFEALKFLRGNVAPFCCHICDKIFYQEKIYIRHKGHCGAVVHECKLCFKRYINAGSLKEHMTIHSNDRPFACTICTKAFRTKRFLTAHTRRHEVKPFKCDFCQRGYRNANLLRVHQKSHLGIRDNVCHVCGKAFTSTKILFYHRLSHFKENNRTCNNCGKELKAGSISTHRKKCLNRLLKAGSKKRLRKKATAPVKAVEK